MNTYSYIINIHGKESPIIRHGHKTMEAAISAAMQEVCNIWAGINTVSLVSIDEVNASFIREVVRIKPQCDNLEYFTI